MSRYGTSNPMWKGGRTIASNGYVLIRVGRGHHLADSRGYAYEHRLVAEEKIGRPLRPGELVHHVNGIKTDNGPANVEVMPNRAHHAARHRHRDRRLRNPVEANPLISCACGCGWRLPRYDASGRARRFVSGHNLRPALAEVGHG